MTFTDKEATILALLIELDDPELIKAKIPTFQNDTLKEIARGLAGEAVPEDTLEIIRILKNWHKN